MTGLVKSPTPVRTFEIVMYVTGWMEGELKDWPENVQEGIYRALERKAKEVELPLAIVYSRCDVEPADEHGGQEKIYIHIIASEIVARDERFVTADAMMKAFDELLKTGKLYDNGLTLH